MYKSFITNKTTEKWYDSHYANFQVYDRYVILASESAYFFLMLLLNLLLVTIFYHKLLKNNLSCKLLTYCF